MTSSLQGSRTVPVVINIQDKTLKNMSQDALEGNGTYGSWTVRAAWCQSYTLNEPSPARVFRITRA